MDLKTEQIIQECIKEKFGDATVIAIAHRLVTIAEFDRVIVMEHGRVKENGTPLQLMKRGGAFAEMVSQSGAQTKEVFELMKQNSMSPKRRSMSPQKLKLKLTLQK